MDPNPNLAYEWHPDAATSHGRQAACNPPHVDIGYPTTVPAHHATFDSHHVQHIQTRPDSHYPQREPFTNRYISAPDAFGTQWGYSGDSIPATPSARPWTDDPAHHTFDYAPNHPQAIISPSPVRPAEFAYFGSSDLSSANYPPSRVETHGSSQPQLSPDGSSQAFSLMGAPSSSYYPIATQTAGNDLVRYTAAGPQGSPSQIVFPGRPVPQQQRLSVRHRPMSAPYAVNPPNRPLRWPSDFPGRHSPSAVLLGQAMDRQDDALALSADTPLTVDHPNWRLTKEIYDWMVATLDPKKRPNKKTPAPSGQCKLCTSVCKRSGTLQQHIIILHRQKLARRATAGQRYHLELALAFVVAQMRSDQGGASPDPECIQFTELLARHPEGLPPLAPNEFPGLRGKLMEFCREERWIGVKCGHCGMMMSRRTALEEHLPMCPGRKSRRASEPSTPTGNQAMGLRPLLTPKADSLPLYPTFHQP
jgi:hypothetical protein